MDRQRLDASVADRPVRYPDPHLSPQIQWLISDVHHVTDGRVDESNTPGCGWVVSLRVAPDGLSFLRVMGANSTTRQ